MKLLSWRFNKMANYPCICGSGKKFKRCCREKYELIDLVDKPIVRDEPKFIEMPGLEFE